MRIIRILILHDSIFPRSSTGFPSALRHHIEVVSIAPYSSFHDNLKKGAKLAQNVANHLSTSVSVNARKMDRLQEVSTLKSSDDDLTKSLTELRKAYEAYKIVKLRMIECLGKEQISFDQPKDVKFNSISRQQEKFLSGEHTSESIPKSHATTIEPISPSVLYSEQSKMVEESSGDVKESRAFDVLFEREIICKDETFWIKLSQFLNDKTVLLVIEQIREPLTSNEKTSSVSFWLSIPCARQFLECVIDIKRILGKITIPISSGVLYSKKLIDHDRDNEYVVMLKTNSKQILEGYFGCFTPKTGKSSRFFASPEVIPHFESCLTELLKSYDETIDSGDAILSEPPKPPSEEKKDPEEAKDLKPIPKKPTMKSLETIQRKPLKKSKSCDEKESRALDLFEREIIYKDKTFWIKLSQLGDQSISLVIDRVRKPSTDNEKPSSVSFWLSIPCARQFLECFIDINRVLGEITMPISSGVLYSKTLMDRDRNNEYVIMLKTISREILTVDLVCFTSETGRTLRFFAPTEVIPHFESNLVELLEAYEETLPNTDKDHAKVKDLKPIPEKLISTPLQTIGSEPWKWANSNQASPKYETESKGPTRRSMENLPDSVGYMPEI